MKLDQNLSVSRRRFLKGGMAGATALGLTGMLGPRARAATAKPPASSITAYADTLEALRKTDPALIHYEPCGHIPSPHEEPKRIHFGLDGRLYVAAGKRVTGLDAEGRRLNEVAVKDEVRCLAVSKEGTMYIGLRDHVEVWDGKGERRAVWDSPGTKVWLTGLAAGEGGVFATDAGNRIVYRWDRSGKLAGRIGEKNPAKGIAGFIVPSPYFDLKIGSDGLLWVVNPGRFRLEAYTFDGALASSWGEPSFGVKGFCGCCNPSYFARLPDGRFVTSEKGLARVKVYSAKGEFESVVVGPEAFPKYSEYLNANPIAMDVAVDSAGRVFVADTLGNDLRIYRRKGQV